MRRRESRSSGTSSGSSSPGSSACPRRARSCTRSIPGREPGGGGAVAAVQLARLAGDCLFLTALGDDELGHRAERELAALGVRIEVAWRRQPQRRAFVYTDANAERTITVMGERVGPRGDDPLPWSELDGIDGVYFTAGDTQAVRASRAARTLVSTARTIRPLAEADVQIELLVSSSRDGRRALTHLATSTRLPTSSRARPAPAEGWVETQRRQRRRNPPRIQAAEGRRL